MNKFFLENYDKLAPVFLASKKIESVTIDKKTEVINLHDAYVKEIQERFVVALGKDRMYKRPCGSVTDQQIWMIGVLMKYLMTCVIRFDHKDFMHAVRSDLGPLLGETGLWAIKNYQNRQADKGNDEKKKMGRVAHDLISKYLESGFDVIGKENKYNLANRFGPKKCPDK